MSVCVCTSVACVGGRPTPVRHERGLSIEFLVIVLLVEAEMEIWVSREERRCLVCV